VKSWERKACAMRLPRAASSMPAPIPEGKARDLALLEESLADRRPNNLRTGRPTPQMCTRIAQFCLTKDWRAL
jgi:hypothetical protein